MNSTGRSGLEREHGESPKVHDSSKIKMDITSLKLTATENWWLEWRIFSFYQLFRCYVSFRECIVLRDTVISQAHQICRNLKWPIKLSSQKLREHGEYWHSNAPLHAFALAHNPMNSLRFTTILLHLHRWIATNIMLAQASSNTSQIMFDHLSIILNFPIADKKGNIMPTFCTI